MGSPRQNGELAESARKSGRCTNNPLTTWIALSGSSTADVHVHPEDQLASCDVLELVDERPVSVPAR